MNISVNEIFDPERVDDVYSQDSQTRADGIASDRATNYSVVRLELLEEIYSKLYSYRIQNENIKEWPQQILVHRAVVGVAESPDRDGTLSLQVEDHSGEFKVHKQSRQETLDVDLVVVAAGYRRDAHVDMLKDLEHLRQNSSGTNGWEVSRDYKIRLEASKVAPDAGIWLQGCNESTHGLSDTLLSILATRGGEMVQNIFGSDQGKTNKTNGSY